MSSSIMYILMGVFILGAVIIAASATRVNEAFFGIAIRISYK